MYRIGQSIDIHQLVSGRKLILGGVEIEHELGLLGHSDADVLCHAIIESIIGALGLGDIGKHFSDTDDQYKGMNEKGYEISNLDAIILIERPKMAPYIQKMKENISSILKCDPANINIKATRGEKLGFVGREQGVVSQCVVMLKKSQNGIV